MSADKKNDPDGFQTESEKVVEKTGAGSQKETLEIDLSRQLGLPGKKATRFLVVKTGQPVKKGELLAARKTFSRKKMFLSPITGTLESISPQGILIIRKDKKKKKEKEVDYQGKTKIIEGVRGWGGQAQGKLAIFDKSSDLFSLQSDFGGKILVLKKPLTRGFCYKAGSIGIKGVVCSGLKDEKLARELDKEILLFDEEEKNVCLPILVLAETEDKFASKFQSLKKHQSQEAIIQAGRKQLVILLGK